MILIAIGIILVALLIIVIFVIGFENFKINVLIFFGSDIAKYQKICKNQCEIKNITNYCCEDRWINETYYNCQDDLLKTSCEIECGNTCYNYCKSFKYMIPCAKAGCSWILKDKGFCFPMKETIKI